MDVRAARAAEIEDLAGIWFEGWHEAHASIAPAALTRLRTRESFVDRVRAALPNTRVVETRGRLVGFSMPRGDELQQLFVAAEARGTGAAAALIAEAEARLADAGIEVAWLACTVGNERAARFYDKCGWRRAGTVVYQAETTAGIFPLEVWRYEKRLGPGGTATPAATEHERG